jgi:hypothetical protein
MTSKHCRCPAMLQQRTSAVPCDCFTLGCQFCFACVQNLYPSVCQHACRTCLVACWTAACPPAAASAGQPSAEQQTCCKASHRQAHLVTRWASMPVQPHHKLIHIITAWHHRASAHAKQLQHSPHNIFANAYGQLWRQMPSQWYKSF